MNLGNHTTQDSTGNNELKGSMGKDALCNKIFHVQELDIREQSHPLCHKRQRKNAKQNKPQSGNKRNTDLVATFYCGTTRHFNARFYLAELHY